MEPVGFNRGFYTVDVRYFYRITADAFIGAARPIEVCGLAVFDKRAILFGSEGNAKIFSSEMRAGEPDPQMMQRSNTPIAVGAGVIACEQRHSLADEELEAFENLFGRIALIEWVDGKLLSTASSIAGCGPAFAAMFLESLGDAGVKHGLPRATAYRLAAQMMMGTAKLHLETGTHPGAMKDAVCSPGGTTIKGVAALEKDGFRGCVIDAIDAIEGE